jgi:acetyl esterase/lipase
MPQFSRSTTVRPLSSFSFSLSLTSALVLPRLILLGLAPEYKYPSQLIEVLAGYHYLVNNLGIPPSKIVVVGESAGGALATSFLLHLARPSPDINLPEELGETPAQPGGAFLISPEVAFASLSTSSRTHVPFDIVSAGFTFRGAFDYIGSRLPFTHRFRTRWMFNPLWHLVDPERLPPVPANELPDYKGILGWNNIEHVELLKSPYVQPSVNKDSTWWKEALPEDGRTVVAWGGLEILSDDVESFFRQIEKVRLFSLSFSPLIPY